MNRRQFLTISLATAAAPAITGCGSSDDDHTVTLKTGFPPSGFDDGSTAEDVTQGLDLTDKTILVTGCNSGMGLETLRVLALRGAHVIGTGRTMDKAKAACDSVEGKTTPLVLELSDFDSVVRCANAVRELALPLDALVCNAGISGRPEKQLINGIEMAFLVNYLGHYLLVNQLIPSVAQANGRIVHVSSRSAYTQAPKGGIRFDTLGESNGGVEYDQWDYYGQSKLANALFSFKLAQKYADLGITSNALHPGFVQTNIDRDQSWVLRTVFNVIQPIAAKNVEEGAATACYAAVHPNMAGITGQFLADSNVVTVGGQHHLEDQDLADRLWDYSEDLLQDYLG